MQANQSTEMLSYPSEADSHGGNPLAMHAPSSEMVDGEARARRGSRTREWLEAVERVTEWRRVHSLGGRP
ncbi:hypothetical protein BH11PSE8_BH11PSE8_24270 [soil metagenome]